MKKLTIEQRILLSSELIRTGKSKVLAYVFLVIAGSLGVHRFYLGRKGTAIAQLVLFLVGVITVAFIVGLIPLLVVWTWVIVDLFLTSGMVDEENDKIEKDIITSL